jgi:hypothetical protein
LPYKGYNYGQYDEENMILVINVGAIIREIIKMKLVKYIEDISNNQNTTAYYHFSTYYEALNLPLII